jgi:flavin-dependent dehydrogenase
MRAGVLQLSRWGVLDAVADAGTPPITTTLFHYGGAEPVQVSIRPGPGVPALYAPRRYLLDELLVGTAQAAGVDVLPGFAVTELLRESGAASRVVGVRAHNRAGDVVELRGRWTVGADGIRSVVAAQTGSEIMRSGRAASAVLYRYLADLPTAGYEWAYADGAAAGLIPTNGGLVCVFASTTPARLRALRRQGAAAAFEALVRRSGPGIADRVTAARVAGRVHGWAGLSGFVRRPFGPGWALVGDAGYYLDPISTHGITGALRDAELLAGALVQNLEGGVPATVAMGRYERTRNRLSARLFDVTEQVAGYAWDRLEIQALLRELSASMADELDHVQRLPSLPVAARGHDGRISVA